MRPEAVFSIQPVTYIKRTPGDGVTTYVYSLREDLGLGTHVATLNSSTVFGL